jgi:hypothetical protein
MMLCNLRPIVTLCMEARPVTPVSKRRGVFCEQRVKILTHSDMCKLQFLDCTVISSLNV